MLFDNKVIKNAKVVGWYEQSYTNKEGNLVRFIEFYFNCDSPIGEFRTVFSAKCLSSTRFGDILIGGYNDDATFDIVVNQYNTIIDVKEVI